MNFPELEQEVAQLKTQIALINQKLDSLRELFKLDQRISAVENKQLMAGFDLITGLHKDTEAEIKALAAEVRNFQKVAEAITRRTEPPPERPPV